MFWTLDCQKIVGSEPKFYKPDHLHDCFFFHFFSSELKRHIILSTTVLISSVTYVSNAYVGSEL
jgi:hypothetical protein